ncbi:MAG: ABC-2 family transporter protein, partial [Clostridia bacterium]|nr:ABC-2 family transporter protein [Clostridia bacterium]
LEFMNIFTDGGREFGSYPLAIYGDAVLKFFTYIIPMALWQYYPLLYLIGKTDNRLYMFAPLASVVFLVPCYLLWRIGVRHFRSTGS